MKSRQNVLSRNMMRYGSLDDIIKKYGLLTAIDSAISSILKTVLRRFYRPRVTVYGLSEALLLVKQIDVFERYAYAVNEINKISAENLSILDVGAGGEGISFFAGLLKPKCSFFLFDLQKDGFVGSSKNPVIIGDGCKLPFRNKAFDVVVSVDMVEHIPRQIRHNFYPELKRISSKKIIITCPLQNDDGLFQGGKYDKSFQQYTERDRKYPEFNTAQHIAAGHPTVKEINRELPNSAIQGYKNCDLWLKYMVFQRKPIIGLFSGLIYYLFWKKDDNKPPYWGAIIVTQPKE